MFFSVLLPFYMLVGRVARRMALVVAVICLLLIVSDRSTAENFLPVFMLGVLLAYNRELVTGWWGRLVPAGRVLVWIAAVGLLLEGLWGPGFDNQGGVGSMLQTAGCVVLVLLAMCSRPFAQGLDVRAVRWLGRRSFSLYLVHEPLIVSIAMLTGSWGLVLLIGLPGSLLLAEVFYRLVEYPSHRLSRAVRSVGAAGNQVLPSAGGTGP